MTILITLTILLLLIIDNSAFGATGCVDNRLHRKVEQFYEDLDPALDLDPIFDIYERQVDNKAPHFVHCTCSCRRQIESRGKCIDCGHYGNPNRHSVQNAKEATQEERAAFSLLGEIVKARIQIK